MKYPSDLTDKQWKLIEHIFKTHKGQHFVAHKKRDLVNAVLYVVKTGCQWRYMPKDFPPWGAVWSFYRRAVADDKWEKAMDLLVKKVREDDGRNKSPSYAIIDSQSAKTTSSAENRGIDGGKK